MKNQLMTSATRRSSRRSTLTAEERRRQIEAEAARRAAARALSLDREHEGMPWYAIFTNPLCERRVELGLIGIGLCAYVPEGRRWFKPRRSPHYVERLRPAMPRYVFVAYPDRRRPDIRSVDGVAGVVGMGRYGAPVLIHERTIADMRAAQDMGALDFGRNPTLKFDVNDPVEVTAGLIQGQSGRIVRCNNANEVTVDLGWISAMPVVSVDVLRKVA